MVDVTAHTAGRISKPVANYEDPAQGVDHCGICEYYDKLIMTVGDTHGMCKKVKGLIAARAWCKLFKTKK
jgi:hypothetical protein